MLYQGESFQVAFVKDNIAEFKFCVPGSVNKLSQQTLSECGSALKELATNPDIKGMIFTSDKDHFIVGADIFEFLPTFKKSEEELTQWIKNATDVFDLVEDLPFPTISAVNGMALGGGCEWTLATDFRVASDDIKIGLPEVKLGIMPGFGGTVRLPRIIGADNALTWITTGKEHRAKQALAVGAIDAVVAKDKLVDAAIKMIEQAAAGKLDWQQKRQAKLDPLKMNKMEQGMSFATAQGMVLGKTKGHYPSPLMAVATIKAAANLSPMKPWRLKILTLPNLLKLMKRPHKSVSSSLINLLNLKRVNLLKTVQLKLSKQPFLAPVLWVVVLLTNLPIKARRLS
jgi:3-hydroxyacyl-CoA dehydrogenase/enoyl-CoA hydratase/3-hydroxybutyryl-CoA epimerase/enoyl-CoA isomerase